MISEWLIVCGLCQKLKATDESDIIFGLSEGSLMAENRCYLPPFTTFSLLLSYSPTKQNMEIMFHLIKFGW